MFAFAMFDMLCSLLLLSPMDVTSPAPSVDVPSIPRVVAPLGDVQFALVLLTHIMLSFTCHVVNTLLNELNPTYIDLSTLRARLRL